NFLAERVPIYPPPAALEAAQDRLAEKNLFRRLGITTTEFAAVWNPSELNAAVKTIGLPAVLKTSRMGYDGKGQWVLRATADVAKGKSEIPAVALGQSGPAGPSAMLTLIGKPPGSSELLAVPSAHLHLYGESPRPARKLGHVTLRAGPPERLALRLSELPALFHRPDFCLDA